MKKIFLLFLFISSFLFAQDEIKRHPLWIDLGSGVATPKAQYNIYPFGNQLGNLGATANRWNLVWFDSTTTNHLASSTLSGGVMGGTSLALGGATIGTNALAVTGTSNISGNATFAGTLYAPNGSAASPSYSFTSDPNSGMYSVGADQLGLSVNGSNMVTVTTTGVGIGMTGPIAKFEVNGTIKSTASETDIVFSGTTGTNNANFIGSASWWAIRTSTNHAYNLDVYNTSSPITAMSILQNGNVGIVTTNPLAKFHDNGTAMFGAGTGASLTDSSLVINYTSGSPVLNWYGTDGDTWSLGINTSDRAVFSGATLYSFDNGMIFADPGTSANSYAITLTADNATTPQLAQIYNAYGASPYIVVAPSNGAGTATPAIYIHSDAMNFIDGYSLTTNTADDDNTILKAVDNDDNVLYEVARLTGAATPTFDLLAGRLTGALNANSQDINNATSISLTDGTDTYKQIISSDKWTLQNDAGSPATVLDVDSTGLASGRYYDASDNTFGEYFIDDTDPDTTSVTVTPKAIKDFSTDAARNQNFTATTDSTITILKAGKYRVDWGATIKTTAGGGTTVRGSIYVNDTRKTNTGGKRYLSGTNDTGNFGDPSILVLAVNDVIKLKYYSTGTPTVVTEHASIVINRID